MQWRYEKQSPPYRERRGGVFRMGFALLMLLCAVLVPVTARAEEPSGLQSWMERALRENPAYQLMLADHGLALQALRLERGYGLEDASLSIAPLGISSADGFTLPGSMSVQYQGVLPRGITWSGSNGLGYRENSGIQFSGQLQMQLDLLDFLRPEDELAGQESLLDEENRLREARAQLLDRVFTGYVQLALSPLRIERAEKQAEWAEAKAAQCKVQYEAGLIPAMDYFTAEDAYHEAVRTLDDLRRDVETHRREFVRLYGQEVPAEELRQITFDSLVGLPQSEWVRDFLRQWQPDRADEYLKTTYHYEKNLLTLYNAEKALDTVQTADDWKLAVGLGVSYGSTTDLRASMGVSKSLMERGKQNRTGQAGIQLERQKLAFAEERNRLVEELTDQVAAVQEEEVRVGQAKADAARAAERLERLTQLFAEGYVSHQELLTGQIAELDQRIALVRQIETWIKAQSALKRMLDCDEW